MTNRSISLSIESNETSTHKREPEPEEIKATFTSEERNLDLRRPSALKISIPQNYANNNQYCETSPDREGTMHLDIQQVRTIKQVKHLNFNDMILSPLTI